jgi:hypothetical protein
MPDLSDYTHLMLGNANQTSAGTLTLGEEAEADPITRSPAGKRHARGVPIVGPGSLGGVMADTDPVAALLAKAEVMGW